MAINWMKKEGNSIADEEKRPSEEGNPGKCYEKLSMPQVKLSCGKGARVTALERGRARWPRTVCALTRSSQCPLRWGWGGQRSDLIRFAFKKGQLVRNTNVGLKCMLLRLVAKIQVSKLLLEHKGVMWSA